MRIYVASSWRNERQPEVVRRLREAGHKVYDFRNPPGGPSTGAQGTGFHWSDIDENWQDWTPSQFAGALGHPDAINGFAMDFGGLCWCDACVLVLPCGRIAHLEAGFVAGQGKPVVALLADGEPELMYRMFAVMVETIEDLPAAMETAAETEAQRHRAMADEEDDGPCPLCASRNFVSERRNDGCCVCLDCFHHWPHARACERGLQRTFGDNTDEHGPAWWDMALLSGKSPEQGREGYGDGDTGG